MQIVSDNLLEASDPIFKEKKEKKYQFAEFPPAWQVIITVYTLILDTSKPFMTYHTCTKIEQLHLAT